MAALGALVKKAWSVRRFVVLLCAPLALVPVLLSLPAKAEGFLQLSHIHISCAPGASEPCVEVHGTVKSLWNFAPLTSVRDFTLTF